MLRRAWSVARWLLVLTVAAVLGRVLLRFGRDAGAQWTDFGDLWELYRAPTLTATFAGGTLGLLGVYVVLRRMVFLAATVAQTASLGVALTFLAAHAGMSIPPTLASTGLTLSVMVAVGRPRRRTSPDALLGFAYLTAFAATLVVGSRIMEDVHDIESLVYGSAVAVLPEDYESVRDASLVVLGLHVWLWRGFSEVSFDRDGAAVRGLPVRSLEAVLLVTLAVAAAVSTRVIGSLSTFAFSVLPAVAALRVAPNVPWALFLAAILGALSGAGGYLAAYMYEVSVSAAQTLLAATLAAAFATGRELFRGAAGLYVRLRRSR